MRSTRMYRRRDAYRSYKSLPSLDEYKFTSKEDVIEFGQRLYTIYYGYKNGIGKEDVGRV